MVRSSDPGFGNALAELVRAIPALVVGGVLWYLTYTTFGPGRVAEAGIVAAFGLVFSMAGLRYLSRAALYARAAVRE